MIEQYLLQTNKKCYSSEIQKKFTSKQDLNLNETLWSKKEATLDSGGGQVVQCRTAGQCSSTGSVPVPDWRRAIPAGQQSVAGGNGRPVWNPALLEV